MLFNSQVFILLFLPAVVGLYYACAGSRTMRQMAVVVASVIFYGWWDVRFVPLLVGLTVATWLIAEAFGRWRRPWIPLLGVALNLGALGLFKYADFFRGTVYGALDEPWRPWSLVLPLGISFFVFQKISYLVDLRRGDRHIYGFLDFCMFVSFFPQLIAGPLVRHNEIIWQFDADPRRPDMWENLSRGFILFLIGVAKKVLLADTLAMLADPLFAHAQTAPLTAAQAWTAAGAYTLQIYFDFSGYSDTAIGLGLMFGLRLPFNFNAPYRAVSVRDFWRRWHMTLSRFLRDYLYIPLGGSRVPAWRQAVNLVLTMLLGGLWHGANWTFVAWGGLHGGALAVNHLWEGRGPRLPRPLAWLLTLLFVMVGWVLFRCPTFGEAGTILLAMAGRHGLGDLALNQENAAALAGGAAIALLGPVSQEAALTRLSPRPWLAVPAGVLLAYLLLLIGGRLPNAFIYFQF
ncbi:MBOAT family O-acyltransferase [Rhodopila sp.]|jgi:D-alanyl-lipoteichoic acid acyltransferase DltB (MBOAT superfamily)|uniref:MBOAT family O-acyltransferase n=1 Tax=Rhodopila sp. TaxID=2480087 RepID=UPI002B50D003|nr:MBOAT family protein [Rhodopila sp.]HVZ07191.1 MBOAT family protein [Rhodopila sp.]